MANGTEIRALELGEQIAQKQNVYIVDVTYKKADDTYSLCYYIDKEGGITVDDCEVISRALGDKLDADDFIDDSYILEVSSPGLGRPLKKEKDFLRSIGKEIEIKLYRAINHQKDFEGILKSYTEDTVTIEIGEEEEMTIAREDIALIRLSFDF